MSETDYAAERRRLMDEITAEVKWTNRYLGKAALDPAVMAAMAAVPREEFVPANLRSLAYVNRPLPIGHDQTISQPYIVAIMTDLLHPKPRHRVLEVGTGCGYQAAVLARLVAHVYSLEFVPELAREAAERLKRLGVANVTVRQGDGNKGWPEEAPFDGIIATAAAAQVPRALTDQLAQGGRLVIPVGGRWQEQSLAVIEKAEDGTLDRREVIPVAFVPLVKG